MCELDKNEDVICFVLYDEVTGNHVPSLTLHSDASSIRVTPSCGCRTTANVSLCRVSRMRTIVPSEVQARFPGSMRVIQGDIIPVAMCFSMNGCEGGTGIILDTLVVKRLCSRHPNDL